MNLKRLYRLIQNDIILHRSAILVFATTFSTVVLLFNLFSMPTVNDGYDSPALFTFTLFIGGFWLSGSAFRDLHDRHQTYFFLMLPATLLEKFLSRLLSVAILYPLGILFLYSFIHTLLDGGTMLFTHQSIAFFNPFSSDIGREILEYIVLQSLLFLGAIYFKTHTLTKTTLMLALFGLFLVAIGILITWFVFRSFDFYQLNFLPEFSMDGLTTFVGISRLVFWSLLAPFCWVVSYQRLREYEDR